MEGLREWHADINAALTKKNLTKEEYVMLTKQKDWIEQSYIEAVGNYWPDDDEPRAA